MRTFLLFLLSSVFAVCNAFAAPETDSHTNASGNRKMAFRIEMQKGYVSGIMISAETDDAINGSMVNEFGISAIDFSYSKEKEKVKLINVGSFLNKWYIKQVLRNDINFALHILYGMPYKKKLHYEVTRDGENVTIFNTKRKIKYTFSPLVNKAETTNNDTEE